jgi:predicted dehydrogenase
MHRRKFLKSTLAATAAVALPAKLYRRVIGANDGFRLAVVGLRGRGQDHLNGLGPYVVALCDCDTAILKSTWADRPVERYADYRELLAKADLDAVSIATPNHLHALIAIEAIRAGKHVYVEKPVSHNVWEGGQIVAAARQHQAAVQCGTQSRSSPSLREAVEFVRAGNLGPVRYAIGTCYKPRMSIGKLTQPLAIPPGIDYDLWCGPAEKRELFRPSLHYDWHWDFNTGNGDMGNQGIHQVDIARWFLGENGLSRRILSVGGRLGYSDAADTPNSQTVLHEFERTFLIFETRGLPRGKEFHDKEQWPKNMDSYRGSTVGVLVQCAGGHVLIPDYSSAIAFDGDGKEIRRWKGAGNHYANFAAAAQANDAGRLHAEIEQGHLSSALCHTGNISHRLGRPVGLAEIESHAARHPAFAESVGRLVRHLSANGIDVESQPTLTLGRDLAMDPAAEVFVGDADATSLLSRSYRAPFEIKPL